MRIQWIVPRLSLRCGNRQSSCQCIAFGEKPVRRQLRNVFLRKLDAMNINAFSLFGTGEALVQTLGFRELNEW